MNALLCRTMYQLATIECDLRRPVRLVTVSDLDRARIQGELADALRDAAMSLADARDEASEILALEEISRLAERAAEDLGDRRLADLCERLLVAA